MATGSQNMTTYIAKQVIGDITNADWSGALLHSGKDGKSNSIDTWIFADDYGSASSNYGIKHNQTEDTIEFVGASTARTTIHLGKSEIVVSHLVGGADTWYTARTFTIGNTGKSVNGNADVSWSKDEILGGSGTTTFLRADKSWTNILTGPFYSTGSPGFQNVTSAGTWAYLQLKSGTLGWDIASNSSQNSGALDFRPHKSTNHGIMISQDGGLYFRNPATEGIYYQGTKANFRMIRFIDNTSDANGNGISIGGGGLVVIGSGESADTILSNLSLTASGGTETTYVTSDNAIYFYSNQNSYNANMYMSMNNSQLLISGSTSGGMAHNTTNPKITFVENQSTQPVHLIYTDQDSYRSPAGLKVVGGASASPAWFEVEGDTHIGGNLHLYRNNSVSYGRIHFYSNYKTWSIYMSNAAASACPSGGKPSTLGDVTNWALRSYIENSSGYGWLWESAAESNTGTPTARMALNANNGNLTLTGNLVFTDSGTAFRGINYGTMGANDQWRIGGAATASNAGYMEIATADDGNEPIYVRQYTGVFSTLKRTLTLLDASGDSSFPGTVTATKFSGPLTGNVTGNCSGSAGSVAWGNVSGKPGNYPGGCTGNAATATKLATARKINGTNFDGSGAITTAHWGTARNITIKDSSSTNAGTAVSVDGSGAVTLLLPSTIKASITGNCSGSSGSCTGNAATATTASTLASYASIGSSTTDHGVALKNWFTANKSTAPRNQIISFYSATSSNGSQYMGYFLSGYANNPYGGFFVCHYDNPYYVGISNGTYTQQHILTSTNYTSYTVTKTGSGASGTWDINVTGSAGSVAWGNVSSKPATATRWPSWSEVTSKPSVQNNLTSTSTTDMLSAAQGKALNDNKTAKGTGLAYTTLLSQTYSGTSLKTISVSNISSYNALFFACYYWSWWRGSILIPISEFKSHGVTVFFMIGGQTPEYANFKYVSDTSIQISTDYGHELVFKVWGVKTP